MTQCAPANDLGALIGSEGRNAGFRVFCIDPEDNPGASTASTGDVCGGESY